jgi:CRISPR-associated endonuclease Csn1
VDKTGKPVKIKPHPAAKEICVLFKDDYIEFSKDGKWTKARIAGYSATNNLLDIRPIFATDDVLNWIIATSCQALEAGWNPKKGQNYISVNKIFGEWQAHKITVSPIGEVRGGISNEPPPFDIPAKKPVGEGRSEKSDGGLMF